MSEAAQRPRPVPEGYGPKKTPEILCMAAESAEFIVKGEPAAQPQIFQRELTLVGAEADITDWSNFEPILNSLYKKVNANLEISKKLKSNPAWLDSGTWVKRIMGIRYTAILRVWRQKRIKRLTGLS